MSETSFPKPSDVSHMGIEPERASHFHARLLDAVQEAVIATDLNGRVLYWNRFAETLYGWTAQEAIGRSVLELKAPQDAQTDAKNVMEILRGGGDVVGRTRV